MKLKLCTEQVINFFHGKIYRLMGENGELTAEEFRELSEVKEIKNTIDVLYKYYSVMGESE